MKNILLVAALGLFFNNAYAADDSWTGFYLGGNAGYSKSNADSTVALGGLWSGESQQLQDFTFSNSNQNQNPKGASYGFQAGYDYQFENKFVLGFEVDYSELNLEESRQSGPLVAPLGFPVTFAFSNKVEVDHTFSVRPKFGIAIHKTLVYITGGYAWVSADFSSDLFGTNGYSKVGKTSKTIGSAIFGAGIEHKFFDNVSAKLEYLKTNTEDTSYTTVDRNTNFPGYTETFKVDLDYSVIRVGINYRF